MKPEVIDVVSRYRCLAKQIHLPLQSGDNDILRRMNRKHTVEDYYGIVEYIRQKLPSATLFTDIIVGFPGETDKQFENTRKALTTVQFNMAYIAVYSPRPGTVSARWMDNIPMSVKKERLHTLTGDLEINALRWNKEVLEQEVTILVTGKDRKAEYLSGHTEGRINVRFHSPDMSLIGQFVRVRITSVTPFSIEGKLIEAKEKVWTNPLK